MALKNTQITVCFTVWDTSGNAGKTGDVANLTLKVITDGTAATPTNSASEVDATNCPGTYKLTLTAGEMNGSHVRLAGKSSTADTVVIPVDIVTEGGVLGTLAQPGDEMDLVDAPNATAVTAIQSGLALDATVATAANLAILQAYVDADVTVDTTQTPWELVWKIKGTANELMRKALTTADGTNVTAETQLVGNQVHTT